MLSRTFVCRTHWITQKQRIGSIEKYYTQATNAGCGTSKDYCHIIHQKNDDDNLFNGKEAHLFMIQGNTKSIYKIHKDPKQKCQFINETY